MLIYWSPIGGHQVLLKCFLFGNSIYLAYHIAWLATFGDIWHQATFSATLLPARLGWPFSRTASVAQPTTCWHTDLARGRAEVLGA